MSSTRSTLSLLLLLSFVHGPAYAMSEADQGTDAENAATVSQDPPPSGDVPNDPNQTQGLSNPGYNQDTQGQMQGQYPGQGAKQGQGVQDQGQGQPIDQGRGAQNQQSPQDQGVQDQPKPSQQPSVQGSDKVLGQQKSPSQNNQEPAQGQGQDQLPPEAPGVKLPKKPKILPNPSPRPTATFTPAPPPPPQAEPSVRPQPSGPKTSEQRSYESAMQARWKAAADEIALLKTRGESLQGSKGKAFRESLRTASGNRSMARTKLNQLVRGSSADFDKLKTGVEQAFTDLDTSIIKVRSYFDEPSPP